MKNRVFVTGADGMLGSMICRVLLEKSYEVTALCLPSSNTGTLDGLNLTKVSGDILDKEFLESAMNEHDYVIHVAAMTNVWPRRIERVKRVNIEGTKNVKDIAEKLQMKRMVYIGSASSFKEGPKTKPGNEDSGFKGDRFGMDYIDSKYHAQIELLKNFREDGFPVIVVNPTFMIGPYDSGPSSGVMLMNLYKDKVPGYNKGGKNFVYSGDVAVAAVNALTKGRLGECYIAGSKNLEYKEFFSLASEVMGRKFKLKFIPNAIVLAFGAASSVIARIRKKAPVLSYGMAEVAQMDQYFDCSKAIKELDMPQTPIRQAIQESLDWFKKNDYLS
ncbi:MAG: NAD-dependent epimerase/dehydratase family protein [Bacteroidia bacterium]